MKQLFLRKDGQPNLLLFFSGWGAEEILFDPPAMEGFDCLLCYDYRSLDHDDSLLAPYSGIRLLAWSMGVWVAATVLSGKALPWTFRLAAGGTTTPVDDRKGIPEDIFRATLAGMSGTTLDRFRRRMCGSAAEAQRLAKLPFHRNLDELRDELACLSRYVAAQPVPRFDWDAALVMTADRIFPPENMRRAWEGVPLIEREAAHYDRELFRQLLSEEEIWTKH